MRFAFLTMADPGDFVTDHQLGIAPLEALGWQVEGVPWRTPGIDWNAFAAVYICTPWDYLDDPDLFLAVLAAIDSSTALLINDLSLVNWSFHKSYLRDLEQRGAAIVPSRWFDAFDPCALHPLFAEFNSDRLVIKPLVGANAADTFVLQEPLPDERLLELEACFRDRAFFVQPYVASIETTGEYSLFYFGRTYSHAIRKLPKPGDFRVQEEHGATITSVVAEPALRHAADAILALVEPAPVYARVDFVSDTKLGYLLMELELIEPSLYLRTDVGAPQRFAAAMDTHARGALTSPR